MERIKNAYWKTEDNKILFAYEVDKNLVTSIEEYSRDFGIVFYVYRNNKIWKKVCVPSVIFTFFEEEEKS